MGIVVHLDTKLLVRGRGWIEAMDKAAWWRIVKELKPDLTEAEYDVMWVAFCEAKAQYLRELNT